ncbi:MAG: hypothetical protein CM15mP92_2380 [Halieaceae bacterium]|nr:MAG: hypothetical protein CM15mP92_2380 [Halieaceae bacterium]
MPGFMDMHVHLLQELDPPSSYAEGFYMNSADIALRATVYARRTLEAGFTTVRDLERATWKLGLPCETLSTKGLWRVRGFLQLANQSLPRVGMRIPPMDCAKICAGILVPKKEYQRSR